MSHSNNILQNQNRDRDGERYDNYDDDDDRFNYDPTNPYVGDRTVSGYTYSYMPEYVRNKTPFWTKSAARGVVFRYISVFHYVILTDYLHYT